MLLRLSAAALALMLSARAPAFDPRVERMNEHWNKFYRHLHGCPAAAREISECREQLGQFDARELERARQAAIVLFELEERKQP